MPICSKKWPQVSQHPNWATNRNQEHSGLELRLMVIKNKSWLSWPSFRQLSASIHKSSSATKEIPRQTKGTKARMGETFLICRVPALPWSWVKTTSLVPGCDTPVLPGGGGGAGDHHLPSSTMLQEAGENYSLLAQYEHQKSGSHLHDLAMCAFWLRF